MFASEYVQCRRQHICGIYSEKGKYVKTAHQLVFMHFTWHDGIIIRSDRARCRNYNKISVTKFFFQTFMTVQIHKKPKKITFFILCAIFMSCDDAAASPLVNR